MTTSVTLRVAFYARVSTNHQAEQGTIASQVAALRQRIAADGGRSQPDLEFLDEGYSGATLLRPALERLRDQAAQGMIDRLYVLSPDRLARNYAYQFLVLDELRHAGVEVVFLNHALGQSPEDDLLLQVQGVIAEYERAKISERCRRGKRHAARTGQVSVLAGAPYGYRYVGKQAGGGQARYEVVFEEARVVQQIFAWVARERVSLRAVCRRLAEQGTPSPSGQPRWCPTTVAGLLGNPAYQGSAGFGKHRAQPRQRRLRPRPGQPAVSRRAYSVPGCDSQPEFIPVPALVSAADFAAVREQLTENQRRQRQRLDNARYLLQGLVVCVECGYAFVGLTQQQPAKARRYTYYRCSTCRSQRPAGQPRRPVPAMAAAALETAVWQDVCALLQHPQKIEEEYAARLQDQPGQTAARGMEPLARVIAKVRRSIDRLLDLYSEGLMDKSELEPRLKSGRERLTKLEADAQTLAAQEAQRAEVRLALTRLQEFAEQVKQGLEQADWATRREVIRALVKRVEVGTQEVRIVYRVAPVPFVERPTGGVLQDCPRPRGPAYSVTLATARSCIHCPLRPVPFVLSPSSLSPSSCPLRPPSSSLRPLSPSSSRFTPAAALARVTMPRVAVTSTPAP
jgi:site-specific DNA recombinase